MSKANTLSQQSVAELFDKFGTHIEQTSKTAIHRRGLGNIEPRDIAQEIYGKLIEKSGGTDLQQMSDVQIMGYLTRMVWNEVQRQYEKKHGPHCCGCCEYFFGEKW